MFFKYNFFTFVLLGIILLLTLITSQSATTSEYPHFDKVIHAGLFCALSFFMIIGFTKQDTYSRLRFKAVPFALAASFLVGLSIELIQLFLPHRSFEVYDLVSDGVGSVLGYYLFVLIYKVL